MTVPFQPIDSLCPLIDPRDSNLAAQVSGKTAIREGAGGNPDLLQYASHSALVSGHDVG